VTLHRKTNRLEHHGIKIEFIGQIELYYDRGNHHEFLSLVKELARPGELTQNTSFDFEFNQVEKPYECYTGANVRLRYFLRVTIVRRLSDMTKEMDLLVHTLATYPEMNNPIKMEVGIEECLHIEFEYNKSKYHLKDVIVGKIYFLLVRIKIRYMEVAIIKRETTGSGPNTFHDNENIAKYEIMDGAPVKGESIPIRVFLAGYDVTPTMKDINKKFSVKYYLNLVLVDEEDRRYFKQQEITLWRKGDRLRKSLILHHHQPGYQVPQAMARHNPGEFPSANVRTAPTPSEPNTPIAEAGYPVVGGPANNIPHMQQQQPPAPATVPEESALPDESEVSSKTEVKDLTSETPPAGAASEREAVDVEKSDSIVAETETLPDKVAPSAEEKVTEVQAPSFEKVSDREAPVAEKMPEAKEVVPEPEPVVVSNHQEEKSAVKEPEAPIEEKMSNLNTNEDEDRPLPPDDDSVPPVDDQDEVGASAVVDNEEEDDL